MAARPSASHYNVGKALAQGDVAMALAEFRSSLAIAETLAAQDPANADWQRDLSEVRDTVATCCNAARP